MCRSLSQHKKLNKTSSLPTRLDYNLELGYTTDTRNAAFDALFRGMTRRPAKAKKMHQDSSLEAPTKSPGRDRVSNGTSLLSGVDGRNTWVRRAKHIINAHLGDLGGWNNTSAAERSLIRRVATLTVELERLEKKFALAGEASETDLDLYIRASGNLRRLLEAIGLQRRSRDITPRLSEYLPLQQEVAAE